MSKKTRTVVSTPIAETPVETVVETAPVAEATKPSDRLGLGLCGLPPMRRMDFQDALLEANREMRLSDSRLALLMMVEHPWGCAIPEHYVTGIRRLYNAGKHTKHQVMPASPVPKFDDNGNVTTARSRKAKTAVTEAEPLTVEELSEVADVA